MIIGIDLGTTNSAAAFWKDDGPELIPNRLGDFLTPSAVSVDQDGTILVGLAARERQITNPDMTATSFKRFIGTKHRFQLGRKRYRPEDLSAMVLRSLKEDAETFLGEEVSEAVITVPAYFNDRQRKATKRAGELAGLKVERLINEPTAAALAHSIHELDNESQFLIFDLGGGTFDVSILEIFDGIIEVSSSTGDNRLGGDDFNEVLIELIKQRFADQIGDALDHERVLVEKIRGQAEKSRRALSSQTEAEVNFTWQEHNYKTVILQSEFEEAAANLVARLKEPILRALRDAQVPANDLSEVILIGGSTRMPIVRKAATTMFGRFPNHSVNPDEAVALGAAVQAGLKARNAALGEVVVTDVCPFSLGVETNQYDGDNLIEGGLFSPIIERNMTIPVSRVKSYWTVRAFQEQLRFEIYQGEARLVEDNFKLGEILVPVPKQKHKQQVDCRFTYDINGLLEVDVYVPSSEERFELLINDEDYSEGDLTKKRAELKKLKVHPRDMEVSKALLARANRCWENALGDERDFIGSILSDFKKVLDQQDPKKAIEAGKILKEHLDRIDGVTFL